MNDIQYIQEISKQVLNDIPVITKKQFFEISEPGDIVLASPPKRFLKMKKFPIFTKMIMLGQGLKTSSSKIIVNNNSIAGYGVLHTKRDFAIRKLTTWLPDREASILIRPPKEVTDQQKQDAVSFIMKYDKANYDQTQIFKSGWRRTIKKFKGKLLSIIKKSSDSSMSDMVDYIKEEYICSNIISVAYYQAGFKNKINGNNVEDIWPIDFLLDKSFQKIGRFGI